MNGERHASTSGREWVVAILIALVALMSVYAFARSQRQDVDAIQAAETVQGMSNYMTPNGRGQDASPAYEGDAVLYEASSADTFLLTDSAKRLPDVSQHVTAARARFEEVRRALASGVEWPRISSKHDEALAALDAAERLLVEKYRSGIPRDLDRERPK